MDTVLVLIDHLGPEVRGPGQELLTAARRLGGDVHAAWLGGGGDAPLDELAQFGAAVVHQVDTGAVNRHVTGATAAVLGRLAQAIDARAILMTSTFENKEVAALLALRLGAAAIVDARDVAIMGDEIVTTQDVFGATWEVITALSGPCAIVALKPMSLEPVAMPAEGARLERVAMDVSDATRGVEVISRTERATSVRPELDEAQIVVVGGRGVDGDFALVEELADLLGAAVGATRVATDEGWISHSAQVGQTGASISPRLYIGAGVSGAVHHTSGMRGAGTIVAVNTDPAAPIFDIADFGVVGDLRTVLPQAIAALRARQG